MPCLAVAVLAWWPPRVSAPPQASATSAVWRSLSNSRYAHLYDQHEGFSLLAAGEYCRLRRRRASSEPCVGKELQQEKKRRNNIVCSHLLGNIVRPWDQPADQTARNIYIDLGANAIYALPRTGGTQWETVGSVSWFLSTYPHSAEFDIVAFEPNAEHLATHARVPEAARVKRLEYHRAAVGPRNDTAFASFEKGGHRGPGHTLGLQWHATRPSRPSASSVSMIDFVEWLNRNVRPQDFVVLKMDIENGEWELLPKMLQPGNNVTLIDEFFFECHHRETRTIDTEHGYNDCVIMMRELTRAGTWVHEWF